MKSGLLCAMFALAGCALTADDPPVTSETEEELGGIPAADCFSLYDTYQNAWVAKHYDPGAFSNAGSYGSYNYWLFAGGIIIQTPDGCSHEIHGSIYGEWARLGFLGTNPLGAPTTNESVTPGTPGGRYNQFEHGEIDWTAATGAHEVRGPILEHYAAMGRYQSWLKFPLTGALSSGTTTSGATKGDHEDFEYGSIYIDKPVDYFWGGPPHAGVAVSGPIRNAWLRLGGPLSTYFSWPIGDTIGYVDLDSRQEFSGGGTIIHQQYGGTWGLFGSVLAKWKAMGGTGSQPGFPISDATYSSFFSPDHVLSARFQNGVIVENPHSGAAYWIPGKLSAQWNHSVLGYPVGDAWPSAGGMYQFFEGGVLYSRETTNPVLYADGFLSAYWGVNAEWGSLGYPTNDVVHCATGTYGGSYQNFVNGMLFKPMGSASVYARIGAERGTCAVDGHACAGQTFHLCLVSTSDLGASYNNMTFFACSNDDAEHMARDQVAGMFPTPFPRRIQAGQCPNLPPPGLNCGGAGQACCGGESCFGTGVCQGTCRTPCFDFGDPSCTNAGSKSSDLPELWPHYDSGKSPGVSVEPPENWRS